MDKPIIDNTNFTLQFILDKISPKPNGHPVDVLRRDQLKNFKIQDITNGSAFTSTVYRLKFKWNSLENQRPKSVILKVPGANFDDLLGKNRKSEEKSDEDRALENEFLDNYVAEAHKREIAFYEHFYNIDHGLRLPKYYYGVEYSNRHLRDGLIIMEDLSARACSAPILPAGLRESQVRSLLDECARMHAASWLHPEWRVRVLGDAEPTASEATIEEFKQAALELAEIEPTVLGPLIRRVLPLFRVQSFAMSHYNGSKYGFPASIVHSDLWSPNVMWERNAEGQASDNLCAIIDWQTVHAGNPCEDICRLLALNTCADYRRAHTQRLLAYYGGKVAECMRAQGHAVPFTLEQLQDAYRHAMPHTMIFFCFGASIYCTMDSVVGKIPAQREINKRELFHRVQMFLEDVATEFDL